MRGYCSPTFVHTHVLNLVSFGAHMRYIAHTTNWAMPSMRSKKTSTLNLRIDPGVKEAVRVAALRERRSVANLVELLIRDHCEAKGIEIPEQAELFEEPGNG